MTSPHLPPRTTFPSCLLPIRVRFCASYRLIFQLHPAPLEPTVLTTIKQRSDCIATEVRPLGRHRPNPPSRPPVTSFGSSRRAWLDRVGTLGNVSEPQRSFQWLGSFSITNQSLGNKTPTAAVPQQSPPIDLWNTNQKYKTVIWRTRPNHRCGPSPSPTSAPSSTPLHPSSTPRNVGTARPRTV